MPCVSRPEVPPTPLMSPSPRVVISTLKSCFANMASWGWAAANCLIIACAVPANASASPSTSAYPYNVPPISRWLLTAWKWGLCSDAWTRPTVAGTAGAGVSSFLAQPAKRMTDAPRASHLLACAVMDMLVGNLTSGRARITCAQPCWREQSPRTNHGGCPETDMAQQDRYAGKGGLPPY